MKKISRNNNKQIKLLIKSIIALTFIFIVVIMGCKRDVTLIIEPESEEVNEIVSFSKDLMPIIINNCSISGCHAKGAHLPDLSQNNAYKNLINGNYINTKMPEKSSLYMRLIGKFSPSMPLGRPRNPSNLNSLTLTWIQQGAKNN